MRVFALDHTLGHDPERQDVFFSLEDRLAVARRLDRLGIDYVEGGCPSADPMAREFFARAHEEHRLRHARLVASVRLDALRDAPEKDTTLQALLAAETPAVAVSACCWHAGPGGVQDYCRRISETLRYLKEPSHFQAPARFVIFRALDFFDSYCAAPPFALQMLEAAKASGADVLCLCDSAGGMLPHVVREICLEVRKRFEGILGIRAHDEGGLAVANTLEAVEQGFAHVEGSINAFGPIGGNANLCSIIANLEYKLGHTVLGPENLEGMPGVARFVAGAGAAPPGREPQIDEEMLLRGVDERLSQRLGPSERTAVLDRIRLLEFTGYDLQTARGTLELLVREALCPDLRPFDAERYELTDHSALYGGGMCTATATIRVGDAIRSESEQGTGPVDALERSLRQCLFALYPVISHIRMREYRVHTLEHAQGSASRIRVTIEWSESGDHWATAGVSEDLIEAAWQALVEGFRLPLLRLCEHGLATLPASADSSWAV